MKNECIARPQEERGIVKPNKHIEALDKLYNLRSLLVVLTEGSDSTHMSCVISQYAIPEVKKIQDAIEEAYGC
jgi:hypothetical protein